MASNNSSNTQNTTSQQSQGSSAQSSTLSEQISSTATTAGSVTQEYLGKGIQYVQQATGQAPSASSSSQLGTAEGGRDTTSVEKAVDNAHPDQVSEFIREKYKSDSAGILKAQDAEELDRKLGADTE